MPEFDIRSFVDSYRETLEEEVGTAQELATEIEKLFKKYFPNSFIKSEFTTSLSPSVQVRIALAKDRSEAPNGILENDPMITDFFVWLRGVVDDDGALTGSAVAERSRGMGLSWHSSQQFEKIKIPFRKTTGDGDRILKAFDRYFSRLRDAVKENADLLNQKHDFDVNKKVR